jgi:23S rRNA pseudouridine1911/1915/1917 synthase
VISVPLEEETPQYPAENAPFTILYEDEHLLAVDKPAGMLIHPSRAQFTGTLANRVLGYYQRTGQNCAFHPMTRLDRDTFGIVLLAKNAHIHALLQQSEVEKTYHAVVFGGFPAESGIIDVPIARKPLPSLLREVRADGKPSLTRYQVLETTENCTRVALQPVTGRTHQLRVHCAHLGCPILGDPQYGSPESLTFSREKGIKTQLLCAKRLTFTHPITGKPLMLESKLDTFLDR